MAHAPTRSLLHLRKRVGAAATDSFFRGMAELGRLRPEASPAYHGVEVLRDIPYRPGGSESDRVDIYRPVDVTASMPVVVYFHGGGFRFLSKDTHYVMGLALARRGYLVVLPNYRLAPRHPYPAAIQDALAAWCWTLARVGDFGGDAQRVAVAGESAGANLAAAVTAATCFERPEPWTHAAFATGQVPAACLAQCGILQVSDTQRYGRRGRLPVWILDRLYEVEEAYLHGEHADTTFADPLLLLESQQPPARPLPPFFAAVGTKDPLLPDTRRLRQALDARGVRCEDRYYPNEIHAFMAFAWRHQARICWADTYRFLESTLGPGVLPPATARGPVRWGAR